MKLQHKLFASVCVLGLCLAGLGASAGVVIEQEQRGPGTNTPVWRITFYLDAGKLRVESKSAEGEESITIFDEARQVLWVIDPGAGTYYEMTPATLRGMQQRMEEARKQMQAQLAQLPPEQRKMMEEMMKQQMGGPPPAVSAREVARGEKVGPFVCIHYELLTGGQRSGEVWAAGIEQLQLREAEYKTFQALGRFLEPLGQMAPAGGSWTRGGQDIQGFPVRSLNYEGKRLVAEEMVVKAERRALEAGLFTLPPGLEKSEFGREE